MSIETFRYYVYQFADRAGFARPKVSLDDEGMFVARIDDYKLTGNPVNPSITVRNRHRQSYMLRVL